MASTSTDSQSTIAQKTWALANNIETVSSVDDIYRYDKKQQQDILAAKPWEKEYVLCSIYKCLHYQLCKIIIISFVFFIAHISSKTSKYLL